MFVNRCISLLLSLVIFVDSSIVYLGPRQQEKVEIIEPTQEQIVEDIIETPVVDIPEEVVQESEPVIEEPVISNDLPFSESEIDLIALVTMAEAEGEPEEGKRLVIDVILNRVDSPRFSNTVEGVIYAKNAFECMWNGRVERCYVRDDIRQLVLEEIQNRTNSNIHYFRMSHYHKFGIPVVQVGNHYFSTY
jgi:N-acetylmuramoyl-L-alanine amidase